MLLLVTILLVVVGTISLVIGFVQSSLLPIYISIACSVLAAVVLLIFSRMTAKSQQVVTTGDGPAPLDHGGRAGRQEREPAFVGTGLLEGSSSGETFAPEDRYGSGGTLSEPAEIESTEPEPGDLDDDFPIERYDSRRVGEILPLLAELDLDELDIVREHEEQGKSRATVLARIDQLIDQLEAEDRQEEAHRFDAEPDVADEVDSGPPATDRDDMVDDVADEGPGPISIEPVAPPPTQTVSVAALPEDDGYFPIEDYDDLRASEILPLLPELDDDELVMVQEREQAGAARSSVLRRIESLLPTSTAAVPVAETAPEPEPPAAPEPEPVLVPSDVGSPPKKAPTKRAPAAKKPPSIKKAPAAKKTVVAAVAPPKKAPTVKKAAPSKATKKVAPVTTAAPAKKAPVARTTTKSATAKKAPPEKVASARAAAATKGGGTGSGVKAAKATRKTTKG